MKYFGESNKYYLQAFVSSSFILGAISIVVYKSEISVLLMLFAVGWVYLDFKEAYSKIKIPIIVTNSEGIKVNFTLIDKKLIKWKDIISFKKGYLGVYKLIHKNGQKALPVGFLNQRDREHLFNLISSNIKS